MVFIYLDFEHFQIAKIAINYECFFTSGSCCKCTRYSKCNLVKMDLTLVTIQIFRPVWLPIHMFQTDSKSISSLCNLCGEYYILIKTSLSMYPQTQLVSCHCWVKPQIIMWISFSFSSLRISNHFIIGCKFNENKGE